MGSGGIVIGDFIGNAVSSFLARPASDVDDVLLRGSPCSRTTAESMAAMLMWMALLSLAWVLAVVSHVVPVGAVGAFGAGLRWVCEPDG